MVQLSPILVALCAATTVLAHGHVQNIVINGLSYPGYDVFKFPYIPDPPVVVGWTTNQTDDGFVLPDAFTSPDIVCHRDATNAQGHAQVAAGDSVFLAWDQWPESHHGPVLDYLAACGDAGCETVDKMELKFFKIDEMGLLDGSAAPGLYASDKLIANGNGWMVKIPESIKPGFYVLRHEIIALHSSGNENGAQNYPQCFNLEITGSGTATPKGVKATELYTPDEDGILFNIYTSLNAYPIPGPTMMKGASVIIDQSISAVTATANATTGIAKATNPPAPTITSSSLPDDSSAPAQQTTATLGPIYMTLPDTPTTTAEPITTDAPVVVTVTATVTEAAVSAEPTTTKSGGSCRARKNKRGSKTKHTKKTRQHARDVAGYNMAPIRH